MGDRVGIPPLGEHRDRHDAADRTAELTGLADRVHDLAKQFLVRDVLAGTGIAGPLHNLTAEPLDFVGCHGAEIIIKRIAGFELFAVDQERVRTRQWIAGGFVEITEQFVSAVAGVPVPSGFFRVKPETKS